MQKINLFPVNSAITGEEKQRDAKEKHVIIFYQRKHRRQQKNLQSTIREEIVIPVHMDELLRVLDFVWKRFCWN